MRIVVGFGPGGPDTTVRILVRQLSAQTGYSFVADSRPDAGGSIGVNIVAMVVPDGYALLVTSASFAVNPGIHKKLPFDAIRDFTPARLPCDVLARLDFGIRRALALPKVRDRFDVPELNPMASTSVEIAPVFAMAIRELGERVRRAGVEPE